MFVPRGNEQIIHINSTVTGLQINITKAIHEPGTDYKCSIVTKINVSDQKYSNGVTLIVGRFNMFTVYAKYLYKNII